MHVRAQIRAAVVATLLSHTAAGTKVRAARIDPPQADQCPWISVHTPSEESRPAAVYRGDERVVTVRIDAFARALAAATTAVDDALDALAVEIESRMDLGLGVGESEVRYLGCSLNLDATGDGDLGRIALMYAVTIATNGPETVL